MKSLLLLITLFFLSITYAKENGGGVVVGNGAGVVENQFQIAYQQIENTISSCILHNQCQFNDAEKEIAHSIVATAKVTAKKPDRLKFVSEKLHPGFFTTGLSEINRIAKTGLNMNGPVYINVDLLYKENGKAALDYEQIVSIMVHELGHQSGIADHDKLDIIAAKIAYFLDGSTDSFTFNFDQDPLNSESINFLIANFKASLSTSIIFNWRIKSSKNLTGMLYESARCQYDSESFSGLQIVNGHFGFDETNNLQFKAWAMVYCFETFSQSITVYRKNLTVWHDEKLQDYGLTIE